MARLFGTDGVRGVVNGDLTPLFAMQLGWALAMELEQQGRRGPVAIGRDTRRSGPMLGAALAAGLCSAGCDVLDLGVLPTPGVAWCTRAAGVAAGVVISASHNPPEYNGIKIFAADGYKLPDAAEDALERRLEPSGAALGRRLAPATEVGRVDPVDLADRYLEFLTGRAAASAGGLPVVLDCGHGAAFRLAPALFERLGARVTVLNDRPDGLNINQGCGSTHPTVVAEAVRRRGAAVGFSFDGDADRCIAVDERGQVVDGDAILAIAALDRQRRGALPGAGVVATIMSNLGLERALRRAGITLHRSPVGDRHVLAELRRLGLAVGGEQSGHVIFLDAGQTTGDGLLTAVELLNVMLRTGRPLSELAAVVERVPQKLVNVAARQGAVLLERPAVRHALAAAQERLGNEGRIVVRPSGTEPVVRVMVEAVDADLLEKTLSDVVEALRREQERSDTNALDA